ncbi:putative aliphatic sulfonates transport permease protein SsuC [Botrimarina colliarenosi]|uniref:Putative aliphatic sulfonates transport permease protein SsuC n=1 Tax=Botrimarina colliarenosi TaxID=2528001 RepID=A0A5C6AMA5_9BACT|nr:ABC transporter permease subunit [Botrimarina colliarenosi]TWU00256.1 putative aliphatic sulfonates transport permease protein SsuC [Botrimarina colliarenosi]
MPDTTPPPQDRRSRHRFAWGRIAAPAVVALLALAGWEALIQLRGVPTYVAPAPTAVAEALVQQWPTLGPAWLVTVRTMALALAAAVAGGLLLAVAFSLSPLIELSLFPYAVALQVTPLVAMAPLLMLWIPQTQVVLLVCAWIVAFFPILASTTVGLRSADPGLRDLFDLYGATRWQRLWLLLTPTALPYFLTGLRTAVNLSLVGTVVAEFVTGASGKQSGLAAAVFEGQYRLDTPLMFAALGLIALTGIAGYFATHLLSRWLLAGWHESTL